MNYSKFIAGLALLGILSLSFGSFASTGQLAVPKWVDCRGANVHGYIEIGAALGYSQAVVTWVAPASDWERNLGGRCLAINLVHNGVTVYVNAPNTNPVPITIDCGASASCTHTFNLEITFCAYHYGCTTKPYYLAYGNSVTAELDIQYASTETYFGSYTLTVTS